MSAPRMEEIKAKVDEWAKMLPTGNAISPVVAERRAGDFLAAVAHLANWRHLLTDEKIKRSSMQTATYAAEMQKCDSKQVTEKKAYAEASEVYQKTREEVEFLDNDLSYLKTYQDIFNNAHIFYRQIAKGDSL